MMPEILLKAISVPVRLTQLPKLFTKTYYPHLQTARLKVSVEKYFTSPDACRQAHIDLTRARWYCSLLIKHSSVRLSSGRWARCCCHKLIMLVNILIYYRLWRCTNIPPLTCSASRLHTNAGNESPGPTSRSAKSVETQPRRTHTTPRSYKFGQACSKERAGPKTMIALIEVHATGSGFDQTNHSLFITDTWNTVTINKGDLFGVVARDRVTKSPPPEPKTIETRTMKLTMIQSPHIREALHIRKSFLTSQSARETTCKRIYRLHCRLWRKI